MFLFCNKGDEDDDGLRLDDDDEPRLDDMLDMQEDSERVEDDIRGGTSEVDESSTGKF